MATEEEFLFQGLILIGGVRVFQKGSQLCEIYKFEHTKQYG